MPSGKLQRMEEHMEKETPEDEEASIKSLADKLATLNQRLIPGQEAQALELAKTWLADPLRDDVNLAVTLASAGVSECTAKEARKEKKGVLWKLSAKFDAEYFAHIRPEYVARCETGIPITLEERKEMRGNSWEVAYLARHLDDGALLSAAKYAGDNSRICLSHTTRWDVPTTYDDSVFMLYLPLLIEWVEKLRQHNALMREELIRLASSPAVKGELEMMRILSVADNAAVEMAERAVRFDTDKATFVELTPPMPGPYSGDAKPILPIVESVDDLHSPGCVSPENHNGPCPTGGFVKPTEPAQLSLDRLLDSPAAAGSHEPPQCTHCDKPATCIGAYEDPSGIPEPACDDCCAHGNEDGYCNPTDKEKV